MIPQNLQTLAQILKEMENQESSALLAQLEQVDSLDEESLNYLFLELFDFSQIVEEITSKEISLIIKQLSKESAVALIDNQTSATKGRLKESIGKRLYEDINTAMPASNEEAIFDFIETMKKLVAEGKLAYTGLILKLNPPSCRRFKNPSQQGSICFQLFESITGTQSGFHILIYAPEYMGQYLRISLQHKEARYFHKDQWFEKIELNQQGFFFGKIYPKVKAGLNTIWLEIPGHGEVSRSIFESGKSSSKFSLTFEKIEPTIQERIAFKCRVTGKALKPAGQFAAKLYCFHCGVYLSSAISHIENGRGIILVK